MSLFGQVGRCAYMLNLASSPPIRVVPVLLLLTAYRSPLTVYDFFFAFATLIIFALERLSSSSKVVANMLLVVPPAG